MAVPTTGQFLMFGHTDNTTIAGAIIEGGANSTTIQNTTDFNTLITLSDINLFDPNFSEGATTLSQITKSSQYRGYPSSGSVGPVCTPFTGTAVYVQ